MNENNSARPVIYAKKGMYTPWGNSDSLQAKCSDNSVIVVGTPSHGGIGIHTPTHVIPEHFKGLAICGETWAWFEEDCAWSAAALMFPDLFPAEQEAAKLTLRNWYPAVYAAHFGRMPTSAESHKVRSDEIKERLKNNYTVDATWGDWAWNVPPGHLYVLGRRSSDGHEAGFLMPEKDFKSPVDEIVLDAYPRWEPDRSLPYTKPRRVYAAQQVSEGA